MVFSPTMNTVIEKMNGTLISSAAVAAEQYIAVEVWQRRKCAQKQAWQKIRQKISPNLR